MKPLNGLHVQEGQAQRAGHPQDVEVQVKLFGVGALGEVDEEVPGPTSAAIVK